MSNNSSVSLTLLLINFSNLIIQKHEHDVIAYYKDTGLRGRGPDRSQSLRKNVFK